MPERTREEPFIAIIGAGFGGIIAAICLKEQLNFHNFQIYEKDSDVGGTWRDNIYPGARCDVFSHFYSLSTDLKPDWEDKCASQSSILAYMKDVIQKHNIGPHIILNTEVIKANWDGKLASTSKFGAPMVYMWDESADLRGKRVAVIGNGCTAAQIMTEIPNIEGIQVVQFGRTPSWVVPYEQTKRSNFLKWILTYIPFANRFFRWSIFWLVNEKNFHLMFGQSFLRVPIRKMATSFIKQAAPKKYHDMLIPDYPVGCRRLIIVDSHLRALHLPNVEYRNDIIKQITPDGILTSNGEEIPVDIVVCATGFVTDKYPIKISGKNSMTVQEYFDKTGGPNAHYGVTIPGFPNFAMLAGPNTATGFTSVLFFEEAQMNYIRQLTQPILIGRACSFEVKEDAHQRFNCEIQGRLAQSVHTHSSWYRVNGTGKNIAIWPGSSFEYWRRLRVVNWHDFSVRDNAGNLVKFGRHVSWLSAALCVGALSWFIRSHLLEGTL